MLHNQCKPAFVKIFLLVSLFSISLFQAGIAGGDYYEIYLNNKLITKQHVSLSKSNLLNLNLQQAEANELIRINYSHCGVIGKGRKIEVKNAQNQTLKTWHFADAIGSDVYMVLPVKQILALQKNYPKAELKLYYYSTQQLPEGRILAAINNNNQNVASQRIKVEWLPLLFF